MRVLALVIERRYPSRSKFLEGIAAALAEQVERLNAGRPVEIRIQASKPGYPADAILRISHDSNTYLSDFKGRLSSRVCAAARALHEAGLYGDYHVTHRAGRMTIRRWHGDAG